MYKTFTRFKISAAALVTSVCLIAASAPAMADKVKPGKPGMNNIVEIAVAVNGQLGVFDTVLAAATCDYFEGAVVGILAGSDKVTLFAPVDSAFADLGLDETKHVAGEQT